MIEEKVAKFRELITRRAEIDAELLALVGGGTAAAPEDTNWKGEPRQRRPKEARRREEYKPEKRTKGEPCSECGSKGVRHFKTCSKDGMFKKKLLGE